MFARQHAISKRTKLFLFVAVAVMLGSLLLYMAPASTKVDRAPVDDRPGFADNATLRPWSDYLSEEAVDSAGIEVNLDGNASTLSSDWCGLTPCGNSTQP
jgi:hypothetical protein